MPSVSPKARRSPVLVGVLAVCAALLMAGAMGCATTQEKAAKAQAQAQHILDARAKRQQQRKQAKQKKKAKNEKAKDKGTKNE